MSGGGGTAIEYTYKLKALHSIVGGMGDPETVGTEAWPSMKAYFPDYFAAGETEAPSEFTFQKAFADALASPPVGEDPGNPSPYGGTTPIAAVDPDSAITAVNSAATAYAGALADPTTASTGLLASAFAWAQSCLAAVLGEGEEAELTIQLGASAEIQKIEHIAGVARITAGLYDIRATMSTHFGVALALHENTRAAALADIQSRLRLATHRERTALVTGLVGEYIQAYNRYVESLRANTALAMDTGKFAITAKQDEQNINLEFEVRDRDWNLEHFQHVGNFIAAAGGAALTPRRESKGERLLGTVTHALGMGFNVGGQYGPGAGVAAGGLSLVGDLFADLVH